jgi:predicted helicase
LHHPGYRTKFADNLKRELPRIPLAPAVDEVK